ncbi:hypothetical protein CEF21_19705 [Bacillus sp. FJAT-42376]|uniref:DUF6612 family protein n=1 Tax=Bacillus sp. FJAT-42376 TaxID=2014076 RepID=UPI000F4E91A7|nr:DUF6612 family protein [Bacillus sp. FJAT-42376]AZB44336.1 hypothetical protein CEF21_19705 [Bacillus sp. FJAT-42376]
MRTTAKLLGLFMVLSLALFGCGTQGSEKSEKTEGAETEEGSKSEATENKEAESKEAEDEAPAATEAKDEKLDADQVLEKSIAAYDEVKSYSSAMNVNQKIDDGETKLDVTGTLMTESNYEPFVMHSTDTFKSNGQTIKSETYMTEDATYTSENGAGWMMQDSPGSLMTGQPKPTDELMSLKEVAKDLNMTENENEYIISIDGAKEEVLSLYSDMVNEAAAALGTNSESVKITGLKMSYTIDKKTFLQKASVVDLNMTTNLDGKTVTMNQSMNGTYDKFNELNSLSVPKEVMDTAKKQQ